MVGVLSLFVDVVDYFFGLEDRGAFVHFKTRFYLLFGFLVHLLLHHLLLSKLNELDRLLLLLLQLLDPSLQLHQIHRLLVFNLSHLNHRVRILLLTTR